MKTKISGRRGHTMCCGGKARVSPMSFGKVHRMTVEEAARLLANCGCDLQFIPKPQSSFGEVMERILVDSRVVAALKKYAKLQSDYDGLYGNKRRISIRLRDAKIRIVELVAKHLQASPPRRKAG
jgi:hypothetical protein